MTAKEYLVQLWTLDKELKQLEIEQAELKELATGIGSFTYDDERICSSPVLTARFESYIDRLTEVQKQAADKWDQLISLRLKITVAIEKMSEPDERLVLQYRYLNHHTWEQIADEMNASRASVIRWHGTALLHFRIPD